VIAPWNYPVQLALTPLSAAIAAGNRVLVKPSEVTPRTSEVLAELVAELFSPRVAAVVTGDREVGVAFAKLPFDHLLFTGSTEVGRHIMKAAAKNLTPVTLELGGKSPTIIHRDFPVDDAMERVVCGKLLNAGQTCIAPDYVLVARDRVDAFVDSFRRTTGRCYPSLADNPDYTSIVSDSHYERLEVYLADATEKGATVIEVNPAGETFDEAGRKLAPMLVTGVSDEMKVMQEEIFGPILPIVPYDTLEDAIAFVNERPRPLALYYFDRDKDRARKVLEETVSGGACVNDVMLHIAQDDMPFGGVGPSGMGAYHGREGFETFSHRKAVFKQARFNLTSLLAPPYGKKIDTLLDFMIGRKKKKG
ncbi:MAG: aldehyde dehydrogenase family protein, partial [Myxococcales bacterium]|nr:aldehyde dehydrogenase family protein [Myxococcales bacterium]